MNKPSSSPASSAERDLAHRLKIELRAWETRWEVRNRREDEILDQMAEMSIAMTAANLLALSDSTTSQAAQGAIADLRAAMQLNPEGLQSLDAGDFIESILDRLSKRAGQPA